MHLPGGLLLEECCFQSDFAKELCLNEKSLIHPEWIAPPQQHHADAAVPPEANASRPKLKSVSFPSNLDYAQDFCISNTNIDDQDTAHLQIRMEYQRLLYENMRLRRELYLLSRDTDTSTINHLEIQVKQLKDHVTKLQVSRDVYAKTVFEAANVISLLSDRNTREKSMLSKSRARRTSRLVINSSEDSLEKSLESLRIPPKPRKSSRSNQDARIAVGHDMMDGQDVDQQGYIDGFNGARAKQVNARVGKPANSRGHKMKSNPSPLDSRELAKQRSLSELEIAAAGSNRALNSPKPYCAHQKLLADNRLEKPHHHQARGPTDYPRDERRRHTHGNREELEILRPLTEPPIEVHHDLRGPIQEEGHERGRRNRPEVVETDVSEEDKSCRCLCGWLSRLPPVATFGSLWCLPAASKAPQEQSNYIQNMMIPSTGGNSPRFLSSSGSLNTQSETSRSVSSFERFREFFRSSKIFGGRSYSVEDMEEKWRRDANFPPRMVPA